MSALLVRARCLVMCAVSVCSVQVFHFIKYAIIFLLNFCWSGLFLAVDVDLGTQQFSLWTISENSFKSWSFLPDMYRQETDQFESVKICLGILSEKCMQIAYKKHKIEIMAEKEWTSEVFLFRFLQDLCRICLLFFFVV